MERWLERDNPGTGSITPKPGALSLTGHFGPKGAYRRTEIHIGDTSAKPPMGWIDLVVRGDGDTDCRVTAKPDDWPELRPVWKELWAELGRMGYVIPEADAGPGAVNPWDDTTSWKLPQLRKLRRDAIGRKVKLSFTAACGQVPIDPDTVRVNAPELRARWNDETYDMS